MALSKITTASLSDDSVDTAQIADDAIESAQLANNVAISTSGAITTTGAFTSPGIDDNGDATTITIDTNEDITAANGMYVSGDLTSLAVDKGGIDRSGNTTRIISGRSGGNYADMSINIAGVGGINRQLYMDYQGNTTLDNGNLVIGTAGKGIDFSAASGSAGGASASILDDYEEGTMSLEFGGSNNITQSAARLDANTTYSGGQAKYVKVGNVVTCSAYFFARQTTTQASGDLIMKGFPFAAAGNTGVISSISYRINIPTTGIPLQGYLGGGTQINFIKSNTGNATWSGYNANILYNNTGIYFMISVTYLTQ